MQKFAEAEYHDSHTKKHGCYEVHPEKEYTRILFESGILREKRRLTLDTGCGSGAFGLRLARVGFQMLGIDISSDSIKAASNMARKQGLDADFVVGDIEKMPFRDSTFHLVFCGFVLHHVPHVLPKVLQQINHVLEDGGKLFMCEPNAYNPGCVIQYSFGKCRTLNERALDSKRLAKLLSTLGFAKIRFKDIGDMEHLQMDNPSCLRKAVRQVIIMILGVMNKVPIIPGAYFVMQATKIATHR